MATRNRFITTNFSPAEPEEFKKWCQENKITIHETGYGDNVYLTTNKCLLPYDNNLVRFTKCNNRHFRRVMICEIEFKGNFMMGCTFYKVDDDGIKSVGNLSYRHNINYFLNAIKDQMEK